MSLVLSGACLGTVSEIVNASSGSFESITITVLAGEGSESEVYKVRAGRDFRTKDLPQQGELVSLNVVVSAFSGRNGAGYRLTALSRAAELVGA